VSDLWDLWNLPNYIGAIDGKYVKIQAPPNSGSKYFSYKRSFSVILLALVDARYKFTVVDIGLYGRNSDGGIFAHSEVWKYLETHLSILEDKQLPAVSCLSPRVTVGDGAFLSKLKEYLPRIAKHRGQ
jgi:hypothetical protein